MFCPSCGKEIFGEARFCPHCGAGQSSASVSASPALPVANPSLAAANNLTDLHTVEWRGECPKCKHVQTFENSTCPNDGSPRVVAFRDYRFGFYRYPVHAASLACLADCNFRPSALECSRCGAGIAGKNLSFRFPPGTVRSHRLFHASVFLATASLVAFLVMFFRKVPFGPSLMAWKFVQKTPQPSDMMVRFAAVAGISGFLAFLGVLVLQYFRPFPRFNFVQVVRAAKKYGIEEARKESVKTAKATARATKDIGKPWFPGSQ